MISGSTSASSNESTGAGRLEEAFIHLGLGATAVPQPPFDGMAWYDGYGARHGADGAEVVICTQGAMTLIQENADGAIATVILGPGDYAINPPGVWHTADASGQATAVFITAGQGTQHRPR